MTDQEFAILQSAINIAKSEQIHSVKALNARLLRLFPNEEKNITSALRFWGEYEQAKRNS